MIRKGCGDFSGAQLILVNNRCLFNCLYSYSTSTNRKRVFVRKTSHYEVLGLTRYANAQEIRDAFIKLSKQYHPDMKSDDPSMHQKFVQINEAYSVLSKPLSRRDYDATLDADNYIHRRMNSSSYRSQSHGYGYSAEPGAQYHYKGHMYDESGWSQSPHNQSSESMRQLMRNYTLIIIATFCTVAVIFQYMSTIPDPMTLGLRRMSKKEIQKYELIMTSQHDGETVYYYAVPKEDDPKTVSVVPFNKVVINEDSNEFEMRELTKSAKRGPGKQHLWGASSKS